MAPTGRHEWLASNDSIALEVPSIIIPLERNLILNPKHARFASEVRLDACGQGTGLTSLLSDVTG
jgi:RES domain-containing protein